MSKGVIEEVISPLLKQLANAKLIATKNHENGNPFEISQLFEKIEREIKDMKDVFQRVQQWERDVMDDFGAVAQHIDDILVDGNQVVIEFQLQGIEQEILKIKDHVIPPLQLPLIESCTPPSSSSLSSIAEVFRTSDEWQQFELDKKILESSAMANLQVSYDNLHLQLKLCFLCFSIFPENSVIKKRPLIYWWIGEGLVTPTSGNTAEEIGEGCFRELISKGLIEPIYRKRSPLVDRCKMHPWVRWMLISVARRARFFDFDPEGNPTLDFSTSRRACLVSSSSTIRGSTQQMLAKGGRPCPDELLTLFNVNEHYLRFEKSWFMDMRKIAVLQLGRWQSSAKHHIEVEDSTGEFLEGLGRSSKHVRYLSLQGISRITELPATIGKLSNLRILDLRACHNLEKLTVGITSLKKLTHLDVSECYLLEHMPKGLGSLSELQVLKGFVIGNSRSKDPCRLNEVAKLEKLRKLSINIGSEAMVTEGEFSELRGLGALRSLTITWGVVLLPSKKATANAKLTRVATATVISLSLPPNLRKLDLRCFPSQAAPDWLSTGNLKSLKKLYIRGGKLGGLGPLITPNNTCKVEVLRFKFLSELQVEWPKLRKAFPQLVYLEIFECDKLKSFPCDADGVWVRE